MSGGKVTNAYPYSDKIYAGTGPARVSSLKLTSYTDESISLSWSAVSGANGYMLYYYNYNTNQYGRKRNKELYSSRAVGM